MPDIDSGYEMIRKIAEREVDKVHLLEYGKVESVNVHSSEDDKIGYTCSVLLVGRTTDDGEMLKIENVPIVTGFMGMVDLPNVDDLVLIGYINGDFELPVILGRLYSKEKLPPLLEEGQSLIEMTPERYDTTNKKPRKIDIKFTDGSQTTINITNSGLSVTMGDVAMKLDAGDEGPTVELKAKEAGIKLKNDNAISVSAKSDINISSDSNINIDASGDIKVKGAKIDLN